MHDYVEGVIGRRIEADELVPDPKCRQHQRVIDCARAGPDFLQPEGPNNARILGQVRFIIPDESSIEDRGVGDENKCNEKEAPKPISLEEKRHEFPQIHTD